MMCFVLLLLCLCHPSDGRIVIFLNTFENLCLKHCSRPAIFSLVVFETLQKDLNEAIATSFVWYSK